MKNIIKYLVVLIIFIIIFIILNFSKTNKKSLDDITIFSLWKDIGNTNEYEINSQKTAKIDVFNTINNKFYKKIAPGSKGAFTIKFKRPENSNYKINIIEKTTKPKNLIFIFENKVYSSIKDMQNIINEEFIDKEQLKINWEWKYFIDDINDIQDTKDGENAGKYIFEVIVITEDGAEGVKYEI